MNEMEKAAAGLLYGAKLRSATARPARGGQGQAVRVQAHAARRARAARNILSDRLRKLVEAGILETRAASDGTAYQEYVLTIKGEGLFPVVVALRQWGERQLFAGGERHSELIEKSTGQPIPFMSPKAGNGAELAPAETEVRKLR